MLELGGIVILGILAQWIAWRLKVPAILPLIITGLLVGPLSTLWSHGGGKWINPIWDGTHGLFPGESLFHFRPGREGECSEQQPERIKMVKAVLNSYNPHDPAREDTQASTQGKFDPSKQVCSEGKVLETFHSFRPRESDSLARQSL